MCVLAGADHQIDGWIDDGSTDRLTNKMKKKDACHCMQYIMHICCNYKYVYIYVCVYVCIFVCVQYVHAMHIMCYNNDIHNYRHMVGCKL